MSRTAPSPRFRRLAPVLAIASASLVACGSGAGTPNADSTTLAPPTDTQEDAVSTTGTDPTDADPDAEGPSDTLRPPDDTSPPDGTAPTSDGPPPTDPTPPADPLASNDLTPSQQALADVAIDDVVERRNVERSSVVVVEVSEVTWSDGSLGCPQRGMQYQQVLTPGLRVIVEADGQRAFYHGTSADDLAYCAAPQPPVEP